MQTTDRKRGSKHTPQTAINKKQLKAEKGKERLTTTTGKTTAVDQHGGPLIGSSRKFRSFPSCHSRPCCHVSPKAFDRQTQRIGKKDKRGVTLGRLTQPNPKLLGYGQNFLWIGLRLLIKPKAMSTWDGWMSSLEGQPRLVRFRNRLSRDSGGIGSCWKKKNPDKRVMSGQSIYRSLYIKLNQIYQYVHPYNPYNLFNKCVYHFHKTSLIFSDGQGIRH